MACCTRSWVEGDGSGAMMVGGSGVKDVFFLSNNDHVGKLVRLH